MSRDLGNERTAMMYKPKRGRLVTMVLWGSALLLAYGALSMSRAEMDPLVRVGLYLVYGSAIAWCLGWVYGLSYTLSDRALRMQVGPIGMSVPLDMIESVRPGFKTGLTWSWSVSLKGLNIARRGKRWKVFISPLNQDAFLSDLAARCPHLELRDGRLSPRDSPTGAEGQ